jgi:hypothetical protein
MRKKNAAPDGVGRSRLDEYDDDAYVPDPVVRTIFGGITPRTLRRWAGDPELGFPPARKIRRRNYRLASALKKFYRLNVG